MAHIHSVYDTDAHFQIDPITRAVKNVSEKKTTVMQYDHNSERFTFELPRYVEDHDMSLCNVVEVHYLNIDAYKNQNPGVYTVEDLQLSPGNDDVVICSWLISQNATQLPGSLNFLIRFACLTGTTIDYQWFTNIHTGISVSNGMFNSGLVVEQYADVLEQWKKDLEESGGGVSDEQIAQAVEDYFNKNPNAGGNVDTSEITQLVERAEEAERNALQHKTNAQSSSASAASAASTASASALRAQTNASTAETKATEAGQAATNADNSATRAEQAAQRAEKAVEQLPSDFVKSVNGIEPDANGNVEITIPDSGGNVENGIPPGGKAGQFLCKKSNEDYDVKWADFVIPEQYGLITYDQDKTITIT